MFFHMRVQILPGQILPIQQHQDAIFYERNRILSSQILGNRLPQLPGQIVEIIPGSHKRILDLHDRREEQRPGLLRPPGQSQIQLSVFQHLQSLVSGLAGNGHPQVRMSFDKILKPGHQNIFTEG